MGDFKTYHLFTPQDETLLEEYITGWKVTDVMPENSMGITTGDDNRFVKFSKDEFEEKDLDLVQKFSYRIFDERFLYYKPEILARPQIDVMQKNLNGKKNLALCVLHRPRNEFAGNFFVTDKITDKCVISSLENAQVLPLYLYPTEYTPLFADDKTGGKEPNLAKKFVGELFSKLKTSFKPEMIKYLLPKNKPYLSSGKSLSMSPEDIFYYVYAIFHSPTYRARYAEFLKIDFPRLPLTSNYRLFHSLARLGDLLVDLHLLEKDIESEVIFPEKGSNEVEFVKYAEDEKVWINKTQYFANVPETAWNFHIGGYQVLHKWLKDRKGRTLSFDDKEHYMKVVSALLQTIELMQKIDETIKENGGFPIE